MDRKLKPTLTIQEVSVETLTIEAFLSEVKAPGLKLSYEEISTATGVTLDVRGKTYLRTALKRLKIEYLTYRNWGIAMPSKTTAMNVIDDRMLKTHRAVKKTRRAEVNIGTEFQGKFSKPTQERFDKSVYITSELNKTISKHLRSNKAKTVKPVKSPSPKDCFQFEDTNNNSKFVESKLVGAELG